MALGPGALSVLLQPSHVGNPASGQGIFRAADLQQQKQQNEWYRGQREQEFGFEKQKQGFEQQKFAYGVQDKRRLEKAQAWDDLLDADASQDPQKMLAAWQKARMRGINIPGYEDRVNALFGSKGEAAPQKPEMSAEDQAIAKGLDRVEGEVRKQYGIKGPLVGENIGDGWEVVETPPEAKTDAPSPAQWLTNEMEARGEIPVQPGPGMAPPPQASLGPPPGLAGGLPQQPPPKPQAPPGALVAYDEDTGQAIGAVSPETALARSRARVQEALSPLQEQATTTAEKRAAAIAMDSGQRLVGSMPVDKVIENAQRRYDKELGRDTAKTVARGGKEAGSGAAMPGAPPDKTMYERAGRTPEEIRANATIGNYVHTKIIQKAQQIYKTQELQRITGTAQSILAKVNKEGGFPQRQSIRDVLRMTEGARQTDADLNYALSSSGVLGRLHMKLNEYVAGGELPHNLRQQLADYATLLDELNDQRKERAADYARKFAMRDPGLQDMVNAEDLAKWADQAALGAAGEDWGPPEAPQAADPNAEADKLMGGD